MMTRETKAGLVVSCSFLCLVGVVLYSKLTGKSVGLAEAEAAAGSVAAPEEPTPIEENSTDGAGPQILASTFDNSGPGPESDKSRTPPGNGLNSPTSDQQGYRVPGSITGVTSGTQAAANNSAAKNSTPESESKNIASQENKIASAPSNPTYSIPDAPIAEADSTTNEKETKSASDGSKNKDRTAKQDKGGSPVDPLAALQKVYQEANTNPASRDTRPSVATASHSDLSAKDEDKDKDSQGLRIDEKSAMMKSPDAGSNSAKKQTVVKSDIQGTKDKDTNDRKSSGDQEPPPIPAGLHDPFHSLPETPTVPADTSSTVNRSPRDAGARKPAVASGKTVDGRAATSGSNGVRTSVNTGGAASSPTITAPSTPINLIPSDGSSAAQTQNGDTNQRGSKVAAISSQDSGLTPGVMPSPRSMGLAPAGDTAPEPNVRLGPPLAGPFANPSTQAPSADPTSALPPSNQFAQATTPSPSSPPTAHYSDNTGRPVQPPAPKVDSYDEETYLCKQGDRFEDISMKFYQTEKYAQALLLFNRNHPRAIAAVRQDPPTLAAGQAVYIPPLRVLEKQYATAIPDHAPLSPTASPIPTNSDVRNPANGIANSGAAAGGAGGGQTSSLLDNRNSAANGATGPDSSPLPGGGYAMPQDVRNPAQPAPLPATLPVTKTPAQGQERTYQVPKNGETFWEISRKTLGNPNRWSEIRRLNPKIEPQYPVPGGTILKMPPDARLEPVNPTPVDRLN